MQYTICTLHLHKYALKRQNLADWKSPHDGANIPFIPGILLALLVICGYFFFLRFCVFFALLRCFINIGNCDDCAWYIKGKQKPEEIGKVNRFAGDENQHKTVDKINKHTKVSANALSLSQQQSANIALIKRECVCGCVSVCVCFGTVMYVAVCWRFLLAAHALDAPEGVS